MELGGDRMSNSDKIDFQGTVVKELPGGKFIVKVSPSENAEHEVTCTLSGKLRMNKIRVIVGDTVTVSIGVYDLSKGIITWRVK